MNAEAVTAADLAAHILAHNLRPTPAQVAALIRDTCAECNVHDVMQSLPPGIEELKARRMILREKLTHKSTTKQEKRDICAEIESVSAEIAKACVGRRGEQ